VKFTYKKYVSLAFSGLFYHDPRLIRIREEQLDTCYFCEYTQARCIYNMYARFFACAYVCVCKGTYRDRQNVRHT